MKETITIITMLLILFSLKGGMLKAVEMPQEPPMVFIGELPEKYALSGRLFQGISSLAVAPNGRIWANWYANSVKPGEGSGNYVVAATSMDKGETWTEKVIIDPEWSKGRRAFDPEMWVDPNGKLWLFWSQSSTFSFQGVWVMTTENPGDENPVWSKARHLTKGVMMCKPIVLSSGEWVLPVSVWSVKVDSAKMVVSTDEGKTWTVRGGANVSEEFRSFDEHVIIEKKDGSLQMFRRVRSKAPQAAGETAIWQSVSNDCGKTWTEASPWAGVKSPSSRFLVRRLKSGKLLLVKHGLAIDSCTGRSNLSAWLSDDDGITWQGGLILDERNHVSYPDGVQVADGTIYITSDHERNSDREIVMARFTEKDVLAGKLVNPDSKIKMVISKP